MLFGLVIACVALSSSSVLFATGGAGHFFGGPASPSRSTKPPGGQAVHQPRPAGHRQQNRGITGLPVCGRGTVLQTPNTKASATLLPCFKPTVNLPGAVRTTTP